MLTSDHSAVSLRDVSKTFATGKAAVQALREVNLEIPSGTFLSIMGPSGSGKSTLLHCAAGLDTPTSGSVFIGQTEISHLNETRRTKLRRDHVGFIFQAYNLVPALTVRNNITLPLRLARQTSDKEWIDSLSHTLGLSDIMRRKPSQLSGGQQQRVAIARALAPKPTVIFADEPTGALDLDTAAEVLQQLRQLSQQLHQTIVMVSHDPSVAAYANAALIVANGQIHQQLESPTAPQLAQQLTQLRKGQE